MGLELSGAHDECDCYACERLRAEWKEKTLMREYDVAVFVRAGKRGWQFKAYLRDWETIDVYPLPPHFRIVPRWPGCNMVRVQAANGRAAKAKAIAQIKARMHLRSQIAPSDVAVCGQAPKAAGGKPCNDTA